MTAFWCFSPGRSIYLPLCLRPSPLCVSICISFLTPLCLCPCSCLSHAHLSFFPFIPIHPCYLPPITTNHQGREALSGISSACSDQRGFLCASPCDSSSEGSIPSIHPCDQQLPALPGPLALFYSNNNTVGGNHQGWEEMLTASRLS